LGKGLRAKAVLACVGLSAALWCLACSNQARQLPSGNGDRTQEAEAGTNYSQEEQGGDEKNPGAWDRREEETNRGRGPETESESVRRQKQAWLERTLRGLPEWKELLVETEEGACRAVPAGNGSMEVLVPKEFITRILEISVLEYPDSRVLLQQGNKKAVLKKGSSRMGCGLGGRMLECGPFSEEGVLYVPLQAICEGFGYRAVTAAGSWKISLEEAIPYKSRKLPKAYDYRETGRSTKVRDQGSYGTCWSFASLTALETALRPEVSEEFSADHMSLHNSFSLDQKDGGEYTMSMAYLLAWQGPVLESQDPYGDHVSPDGLEPARHVQEIRILPSRDYEAIKKAVFLYGGVQSSLYTSITGSDSRSVFYREEASSYCYQGDQVPNHDVVIVGWDDGYPKENFQVEPEGDGAFLCVSSWGEAFGDKGYFYVSYYDSNIGGNSLAYTGIEPADNYDNIYQSDLCGWVGQVGYGSETAFGANVYEAGEGELLKAAGFYAVGEDTYYEISVVHHAEGEKSLGDRKAIARGTVEYSGFYTIPFEEPERLEPGERFALVLEVRTPGVVHPVAVEYQADDATSSADATDGESYISLDGSKWEPMEERYQCNLCLKGYTDKIAGHEGIQG